MLGICSCDACSRSNHEKGANKEVSSSIYMAGMDLNDFYLSAPKTSACSSPIRAALTS